MKRIPLTSGKFALVDDADFTFLNQWTWRLNKDGYANRRQGTKRVFMHRLLNGTPDGLFTDHINRNKLDNRKKNLRTCDKSLNGINRGAQNNNKSGHKGVYFEEWTKKWCASLFLKGKRLYRGRFSKKEDAIKARLKAEQKYHVI